ncbi:rhodanese-like domain-containing protein [Candidatus Woesearchaeota archaeon]|nr:rhodanese-like domain-containing protein [Candidatus Woesearchaeota archaeon]
MKLHTLLVISIIVSAAVGAFAGWTANELDKPTEQELIKGFYDTENAVHVSPHSIRKKIDSGAGDYILVDLRSAEEYMDEHIKGAINIPAYRDPDTPAYYDVDRIVGAFADLPDDREVIVYCYSVPCMTGRKIGKLLADRGIFVKHLGIGWNEWKYGWTGWNHEHEWNATNPEEYIATGPLPYGTRPDEPIVL